MLAYNNVEGDGEMPEKEKDLEKRQSPQPTANDDKYEILAQYAYHRGQAEERQERIEDIETNDEKQLLSSGLTSPRVLTRWVSTS